ncbi:MAG: hypothetical protein ACP5HJ_02570 [Candidatus Micrarchaeia archaeon]
MVVARVYSFGELVFNLLLIVLMLLIIFFVFYILSLLGKKK